MIDRCPYCGRIDEFPHLVSVGIPRYGYSVVWSTLEKVRCRGCRKIFDEDLLEEVEPE